MIISIKNIKKPFIETIEEAAKNWRLLLLMLMVLAGGICGALVYSNCGEKLLIILNNITENLIKSDYLNVFKGLFLFYITPLIIIFLCSFSALGLPFILAVPIISSAEFSLILSNLYCRYHIDGVVFSLILVIPSAVIYLFLLLLGCNDSLVITGIITKNVFAVNKEGRGDIKAFFIRFLVILMINILIILIQSLCVSGFGIALIS